MERPLIVKIDEEIQSVKISQKNALENLRFAQARAYAIQRRIDRLIELKTRFMEGQLEFNLDHPLDVA